MFVVTGAAGSIVSAITADLAAAVGGTFHLLDLDPGARPGRPRPRARSPPTGTACKRDARRRGCRSAASGRRPVLDRARAGRLERLRAALDGDRRRRGRRRHGPLPPGRPHRRRRGRRGVDGRGPRGSGRIDVLAARGRASRSAAPCPTRSRASSTSSSTSRPTAGSTCCTPPATCRSARPWRSARWPGRFGNAGQTDYSAANDLLCKIDVAACARTRPDDARASRSTGPPGAASAWRRRGSIPKIMEMAGIEMLPPEAGVAVDPARARPAAPARRGRRRRRARRDDRGATTRPAGSTPRRVDADARARWSARVAAPTLDGGLRRAHRRSTRRASRSCDDHRIDGTAGAARA